MRPIDVIQTALANLTRRKVRSFLTIFGIFVGILTIVTMTSMGVGVQLELERNIRAIGLETIYVSPTYTDPAPSADPFALPQPERPITPALVEEIEALPGVASVVPLIEMPFGMDIGVRLGEQVVPLRLISNAPDPEPFEPEIVAVAGQLLPLGAQEGLVVSEQIAEELGIAPADLVGQSVALLVRTPRGEETEVPSTIVGVFNVERRRAVAGLTEQAAIKGWWLNRPDFLEEEGYDELIVQADRIEDVTRLSQELSARNLEPESLQQVLELAGRIFAVLQSLLASVGALALFVASLGVVNTMIMAIYERTREIGILKATGASPGDIRLLFMVEAAMMGFVGGLAGVIFGALLGKFIDWLAHQYLASEQVTGIGALSVVPPWLALGAMLFGMLVGLLAGLYPAARAAALDPVQALRYD